MTGENRLPVLAAEIREAHSGARAAARLTTEKAIEAGERLLEAKALIQHGEWLPWVHEHCEMGERMARNYMRLARQKDALAENGNVADLTIRDALKVVADHDPCPELPPEGADSETVWEWADRQCAAPFNKHDLENPTTLLRNKLFNQAGVPTIPAFLLGVETNIPLLTLASSADLDATLECLAPFAKGKGRDLDIDYAGLSQRQVRDLLNCIEVVACRYCGEALHEYDRRAAMTKGGPDAFDKKLFVLSSNTSTEVFEMGLPDFNELQVADRVLAVGDFAVLARIKALSQAEGVGSKDTFADRFKASDRVRALLQSKAATPAGTTGEPGFAGDMVDTGGIGRQFLESLRNVSAFDAMLRDMRTAPLRTRFDLITLAASGSEVAEGAHKPVGRFTSDGKVLERRKASAIVVLTREVAESLDAGVQPMIGRELRNAVAAATDDAFAPVLSALAATSPAVTASGSDSGAVLDDLTELAEAVTAHRGQRLYLIAAPVNVRRLALKKDTAGRRAFPGVGMDGGDVAGIRVLPCDAIAADEAILVDASQIAANGGTVGLGTARHASIKMDDSPSDGAGELVSLWQTNSLAFRAERWFGFEVLREGTIATLAGVNWENTSGD